MPFFTHWLPRMIFLSLNAFFIIENTLRCLVYWNVYWNWKYIPLYTEYKLSKNLVLVCSSIQERIAMSSLQGLPPLPRSLSGFNLSGRGESGEPPPPPTRSSSKSQRGSKTSLQTSSSRPSPPARQLTTLDTQLAVLRREMVFIRKLFSLFYFSINIALSLF